jgi:hypothetical protein
MKTKEISNKNILFENVFKSCVKFGEDNKITLDASVHISFVFELEKRFNTKFQIHYEQKYDR